MVRNFPLIIGKFYKAQDQNCKAHFGAGRKNMCYITSHPNTLGNFLRYFCFKKKNQYWYLQGMKIKSNALIFFKCKI